jgi:AcrR family transcriptional regulator
MTANPESVPPAVHPGAVSPGGASPSGASGGSASGSGASPGGGLSDSASGGLPGGPKQDRSRATRQRLLETTIRCLATHGWETSTVGFIAAEAGISRGAVQHHYRTREDLILAALEYIFASRVALLDELPEPPGTGPERVHAVVADLVEAVGGELFRAALQVWTVAAADPELRAAVVPLEKHFAREVHRRAVRLLHADDSDPAMRGLIQATLDLARGLALADVLTDDSRRRARVVRAWSTQLATVLA